jgi:hypothetical protein
MDESQVVQASCDQNWYHYLQFWIHRADGGRIQEQLQVEKSHHAEPPTEMNVIGRRRKRRPGGKMLQRLQILARPIKRLHCLQA